ncbi:hypothetical protein N0102_34780, partial [Pseudomonas aeruginosa]|nr:hypothetical protein [Pseudomonas aeruginosa]
PAGLLRSFLLVAASDDQLLGCRGNSLYNVFREKRLIAVWAKRSHLRAAPRFVDHLGRTAADCKLLCLMKLSAAPVQILQAAIEYLYQVYEGIKRLDLRFTIAAPDAALLVVVDHFPVTA